jgi:hypothetical protein
MREDGVNIDGIASVVSLRVGSDVLWPFADPVGDFRDLSDVRFDSSLLPSRKSDDDINFSPSLSGTIRRGDMITGRLAIYLRKRMRGDHVSETVALPFKKFITP